MTGDTLLETLQADVVAVLANCPELADANIIPEDDGDMEQKILRKLGTLTGGGTSKAGLVLVVMLPQIEAAESNLPGPAVNISLEIQVIEQPTINRSATGTGIRSSVAAIRALAALHLHSLGHCALYAGQEALKPVNVKPGFLSHTLKLAIAYRGITRPDKPAGVGAVYDDQAETLALSCATPGSTVYLTWDGSYPTPTNPAGCEYFDPIQALVPGTFTVAGSLTSDGVTAVTFAGFRFSQMENNRPRYASASGPDGSLCIWNSFDERWELSYNDQTAMWHSYDDVASPDLCTTWVATGTATGTPVLTAGPALLTHCTVVRAAAYAAGMLPGDVTEITITDPPN
jgi:hypothetical protein